MSVHKEACLNALFVQVSLLCTFVSSTLYINPYINPVYYSLFSCISVCYIIHLSSLSLSLFFSRFSVSIEPSTTLLPPSLPSHTLEPVRHYIASLHMWALRGEGTLSVYYHPSTPSTPSPPPSLPPPSMFYHLSVLTLILHSGSYIYPLGIPLRTFQLEAVFECIVCSKQWTCGHCVVC